MCSPCFVINTRKKRLKLVKNRGYAEKKAIFVFCDVEKMAIFVFCDVEKKAIFALCDIEKMDNYVKI
jgi:hypothetical protein